jgi:amino acid adenylation domain-containing protein
MTNPTQPNETIAVAHDPFAGPAILMTIATTEPQREIWTAAQVGEDASLAYNESITLWMRGPLDLDALRSAFAQVVMRHEALRSTFEGDGLTTVVGADSDVLPELIDVAGEPADAVEAAWKRLLEGEVTRSFDLIRGPLVRVKIFRLGADEHRVTFTAHHIVCDGWSTAVVVREWAAIYSALVGRRSPVLGPADAFSAYAAELGSGENAQAAADDLAYWVGRFVEDVPILELPLDHPRPPLKSYASRREDYALDEELVRGLRRVGSAGRASLFVTLLAGFDALLARLSAQSDIVVGIPSAGQSLGGHDELVGHCVNILPLRARIDPEKPFRDLLADTRSTVLEAYEHQRCTFGGLLKTLPLARDPSRLPLVSVVFNLDRGLGPEAISFEGLRTELTTNPRHFENFDLFLNAVELAGKVTLECQYNTDLFDGGTIRRWLATYERLLRSVCERPDERVGWLGILTDADGQLLRQWNAATRRDAPKQGRVHELIEAQVARSPEAIAVEMDGVALTYATLDARSEALASRLRASGVKRGSLVGLCVERSPELLVGVLGILKAGGAYVPLDPGYPIERLAFMVRDSRMHALVTQDKLRAELPLAAPNVLAIEDAQAGGGEAGGEGDATPDDPAYVIYTSGSTGVPKGVLVPHRAVVNLLSSVREEPGMTASDVVLAVTTLSFDIAVSEVLLPLTVGAKIALASREVASDGDRLLALMHASKATFLDATPATWRLLLAAGWRGGEGLKAICTGEALPRDLAIDLVKRCATVWNGYGPTETTVWSTFWRVEAPVQRVLIGKPVANTLVYVLDSHMLEVPIGVIGELFIGGAGVTLGYHERPELTRERFLPDPFRGGDARMYKTGDLVRLLPDGNLECLGRNDTQVKLRGYRIELGEIENVLAQHPDVAQAAATVREDRPGDRRLIGYTVRRPGAVRAGDGDLREHLKKTLPEYMVPQHFVELEKMPLLPNGKIDRRKLPAPDVTQLASTEAFVAPRSPSEQMLAKLWEEILAIGRVGANDDFFALGGHSLLASQVIARLRRDHGVDVSFRKMFEAPTVARLAAVIDASIKLPADVQVQIPRRADTGPIPPTIAQRRMWLLEEMDPKQRIVHNLCASWRLEGKLDIAALQSAIDEIVRRHDSLRTNFSSSADGEPLQVVHADRQLPLRVVDLTPLPRAERDPALDAQRDADAVVVFDLARDPLFRGTLFKLEDEVHVLSTVQHNIVWDGWSFDIFLNELSVLYGAMAEHKPSTLPPLPVSYSDFAAWQREWMASEDFNKQASFWRGKLADPAAPLEIPTDHVRKGTRSHAGGSEGIHLSPARAEALTALARDHGATLFMVVFAAFNVLLHRQTGQTELLIGTPMRARSRPELENVIGPFVNTVALRTAVEPSMTFLELVERVREVTLDAFGNQDVPVDALGVRPPMMRALFSLQDATTRPVKLGDLRVSQEHALAPVAASEMMLWVMESKRDLLLMLNYAADLFEPATALRFLRELDTLLEQVQRDPRQPVASIPILAPDERKAIALAGGEAASVAPDVVLSRIRRVAAERPDAIAVRTDGRELSYAKLLLRASTIADALRSRGASPGSRVLVRLPNADDRITAILGVLEVGATIVFQPGADADMTVDQVPDGPAGNGGGHLAATPSAIAYVENGVAVNQAALAHCLGALSDVTQLRAGDLALVSSRLDDVSALCAVLLPLSAGTTIVVAPSEDPDAVQATIAATGPSVLVVPSKAWRLLPPAARPRTIVIGMPSAALRSKLAHADRDAMVVHFSDALGLPSSVQAIAKSAATNGLGRPLPGQRWRVVDAHREIAPVGVIGELEIDFAGGTTRTGDRVRLTAGGTFEYVGRADGKIKLGTLLDPAQISEALRAHPAVQDGCVTVREDTTGEPRLVAYYTMRPGSSCTETELRAGVRKALGESRVPRMFVELDALPRDAAGMVDDERLPSPYEISSAHEYRPPQTEAEKYIANVWREALGIERIGIHDNFFDLGGHSLLCFRVIARIERETGKRVSPRHVLLNSLAQVATQLGDGATEEHERAAPANVDPRAPDGSRSRTDEVVRWFKGLLKG